MRGRTSPGLNEAYCEVFARRRWASGYLFLIRRRYTPWGEEVQTYGAGWRLIPC